MSYSNYDKAFTQLRAKPAKMQKYIKHNAPKKRSCGLATKRCKRCGRIRAQVGSYGLKLCRHCFREISTKIGFKKYN